VAVNQMPEVNSDDVNEKTS